MSVRIPLDHVTLCIAPGRRYVETVLPDGNKVGRSCYVTPENLAVAREVGYTHEDEAEAVWTSLVDHELLQAIAAQVLLRSAPLTLRFEAGVDAVRHCDRVWEEAVTVALQLLINTNEVARPLENIPHSQRNRITSLYVTAALFTREVRQ